MKNSLTITIRRPQASALLISLLLMTFLLIFGLGLSRLVIDAIRVERNVVDAGKAYFTAEAGVEWALYYRENHLPGYQVQDDDSVQNEEVALTNGATVDYRMVAMENNVPCSHRSDSERALELQDSVSLPLYHWDPDVTRVDLTEFQMTFSVARDAAYNWVNGEVLRWKILGIDETHGNTEAISGLLEYDANDASVNVLTSDDSASFYDGVSGSTFVHDPYYPISTFLDNHYFNTLVLTNIISLNAQDQSVQSAEDNVILFTLSAADQESTVCEYTLIEADGHSGDVAQNIDVQVRLDTFLPVFNFALYHIE